MPQATTINNHPVEVGKEYLLNSRTRVRVIDIEECGSNTVVCRGPKGSLHTFDRKGFAGSTFAADHPANLARPCEPPPFRITTPGVYRCRDGVRVYIYAVGPESFRKPMAIGMRDTIESTSEKWHLDGQPTYATTAKTDIVEGPLKED